MCIRDRHKTGEEIVDADIAQQMKEYTYEKENIICQYFISKWWGREKPGELAE